MIHRYLSGNPPDRPDYPRLVDGVCSRASERDGPVGQAVDETVDEAVGARGHTRSVGDSRAARVAPATTATTARPRCLYAGPPPCNVPERGVIRVHLGEDLQGSPTQSLSFLFLPDFQELRREHDLRMRSTNPLLTVVAPFVNAQSPPQERHGFLVLVFSTAYEREVMERRRHAWVIVGAVQLQANIARTFKRCACLGGLPEMQPDHTQLQQATGDTWMDFCAVCPSMDRQAAQDRVECPLRVPHAQA